MEMTQRLSNKVDQKPKLFPYMLMLCTMVHHHVDQRG